ncbi:hypothetical protein HDU91_003844 [Kappamyces sp. JEL0680]|nr:hypothetical protein HDU91_003844 [Kappamyces sp. JEL0680]
MPEQRRPSDANPNNFNPLEDSQFADMIQDLLLIYTPKELEAHSYLQAYLVELLARWGRWHSRGRAPALCFEAACVGGLSFLNKTEREPGELTGRADAALARLLAGIVIDEVEPMARKQGGAVREKAIGIVADEFLARTVSKSVASSAKKRMKKRKTVIKMGQDDPVAAAQRGPGNQRRPSATGEGGLFPRPVVGMRRPSVGDTVSSGLTFSSGARQDYYDPTYRPEVVPNMDPIPGPNSYYADTSYGRRRKGSQDSSFDQTQLFLPNSPRSRQDTGGAVGGRGRQGSVPFAGEAAYESRSRQGSLAEGYDGRYQQPQQSPIYARSRKGSAEPPYSATSSPNAPYPPFPEGQSGAFDPSPYSRTRKPSADSKLPYYGNSTQQPFGSLEGPNYVAPPNSYPNEFYDARGYPKSRKDSFSDDAGYERPRLRAASIDRGPGGQYESRYPANRPTPLTGNPAGSPNRRPSQKGSGFQAPQRTRYPSEGEPMRQDGDRFPLTSRPVPAKPQANIPNRPGNMAFFPAQRTPDQFVEQDLGFRTPPPFSRNGEPRRPSQDRGHTRRPSYDESIALRAGASGASAFREDNGRPLRSKTPNPADYRKGAGAIPEYPVPSGGFIPPPRSKTPGTSRSNTPGPERRPGNVEELGNILSRQVQNFLDEMKK